MRAIKTLLLCGVVVPLLAGTSMAYAETLSTPAEQAETDKLNTQISESNAQVDAQADKANTQYQAQQDQYQAQVDRYEEASANYERERAKYVAANTKYRRIVWPSHYRSSTVLGANDLLNAPVETVNGSDIGHVSGIARDRDRHISALRVAMIGNTGEVWIDASDLRLDTRGSNRIVVTDLDRGDLREMSAYRF